MVKVSDLYNEFETVTGFFPVTFSVLKFDLNKFKNTLSNALKLYSRFRPKVVKETITVVNGLYTFVTDIPDNIIRVAPVDAYALYRYVDFGKTSVSWKYQKPDLITSPSGKVTIEKLYRYSVGYETYREYLGVGDDIETDFNLTLENLPVKPTSISFEYLEGTVTDDGNGALTGDATGTIDYEDGVLAVTFTTPPSAGVLIYVNYEMNQEIVLNADSRDELNSDFDNYLAGLIKLIVGRSVRGFTIPDLPFQSDADTLVTEGQADMDTAYERISDNSKWWKAVRDN